MAQTKEQQAQAEAFVQGVIESAANLLNIKAEVLANLQDHRDTLGFAAKMGQASPEQLKWIEANLPKRTRGPRDRSDEGGGE